MKRIHLLALLGLFGVLAPAPSSAAADPARTAELARMVEVVASKCIHYEDMAYTVDACKRRLSATDEEIAAAFWRGFQVNGKEEAAWKDGKWRQGCLFWFSEHATDAQLRQLREAALRESGSIGEWAVYYYFMRKPESDESLGLVREVLERNPGVGGEAWRRMGIQLRATNGVSQVRKEKILALVETYSENPGNADWADLTLCDHRPGYSASDRRLKVITRLLDAPDVKLPPHVRGYLEARRMEMLGKASAK